MHGVERGKRWRWYQSLTYRYSFFTDPTISTLTSGTPSQNVDLGGLSFPRRLGVRFNSDFIKRYSLSGMQVKWDAFEDCNFTKPLGKDFEHTDTVSREGWAMYYFDGKFEYDTAYLRLRIVNPDSGMLMRTFYFMFQKSYQMSLNARYYITDPVLGDKIVKNGILTELKLKKSKDGKIAYQKAKTTFKQWKIRNVANKGKKEIVYTPAIIRTMVRYSERPKMLFLVTPPHLMKYAKLILILLTQLVNLNFDKSYLTKTSQKPLYKTRFMLDELGNLQSEGHGIQNFQTMLSIGLGQDQQFTLILQTLQQLRDVYGDSADKIIQGNTSNIVFLKSTDDAMLDTLQKMSGTTHRAFIDGKTITRDLEKLFLKNEGKVSYNMSIREMPVISYNDMAFISERNSIVFRAGDSPIWNRNETILPMSWRLFSNTIVQPGKEYSLQTVPTLSSALEFDVRKNQPDFVKMWEKRKRQAMVAGECREAYMSAYGFNDYDMEQLDPDIAADEIMDVINTYIQELNGGEDGDLDTFEGDDELWNHMEENLEQIEIVQVMKKEQSVRDDKRFGGGLVSPSDLRENGGSVSHSLDYAISEAFNECKDYFWKDSRNFKPNTGDGKLYGIDGSLYISPVEFVQDLQELNMAGKDVSSPVYSERPVDPGEVRDSYEIHDEFIKFLASCSTWNDFASGKFESEMKRVLSDDMIQ